MKRYLTILTAALAILVSCGKEPLAPDNDIQQPAVSFRLNASHPDATKAVKTGWEAGDAIFVFFTGAAAPRHLKMTYNGSGWTSAEYNGTTQTAGALGLKNGDNGTMRAVFLPFGSDATVAAGVGGSFVFNTTYYAYYLTATLSYTVKDNEVSGAFDMRIPDGYVQFFVEDETATDGVYTLATDAVIPAGVASVAADGTITETSDKNAGDAMTGYAYGSGAAKGYLFSGKLNGTYAYSGKYYYFAKTKADGSERYDYFVSGKSLASHSAVKLPANSSVYQLNAGVPNDGKWVRVGSAYAVNLFKKISEGTFSSLGTWSTCNYGQSVPEEIGTLYSFGQPAGAAASKALFELIDANCTWTYWVTVHGKKGVVVQADKGFIFLPAEGVSSSDIEYWTSTPESTYGWYFIFPEEHGHLFYKSPDEKLAVRTATE